MEGRSNSRTTSTRAGAAISDAKDLIGKLQKTILKLKGDHPWVLTLPRLLSALKEAAEVRNKENDEYENTKTENEQSRDSLRLCRRHSSF